MIQAGSKVDYWSTTHGKHIRFGVDAVLPNGKIRLYGGKEVSPQSCVLVVEPMPSEASLPAVGGAIENPTMDMLSEGLALCAVPPGSEK